MFSKFSLILLIIIGISNINCNLYVTEPQSLIEELDGTPIPFVLNKFGDIPYGQTLQQELKLSDPIVGCKHGPHYHKENEHQPFLLMEVGGGKKCSTTKKLYHAQKRGASFVILQSDKDDVEDFKEYHSKYDFEFEIPSVVIPQKYGKILQRYVKQKNTKVVLSMHFQKNLNDEFFLFLDVRNLIESAKFVNHFSQESVDWFPHYDIKTFFYLDSNYEHIVDKKCYGNGKYCLENYDQLNEAIFQSCLLKLDNKLLFEYYKLLADHIKIYEDIKKKHDKSWQSLSREQKDQKLLEYTYSMKTTLIPILIGENVFKNFNIFNLRQCVQLSHESGSILKTENDILDQSIEAVQRFEINYFPSVVINNKVVSQEEFHKKIHKKKTDFGSYVLYQLCKQSQRRTYSCSQYISNFNSENNLKSIKKDLEFYDSNTGLSVGWIIIIIVLCFTFVGMVVGYWYKRRMNAYYDVEADQIESLVKSYKDLHNGSQVNVSAYKKNDEEKTTELSDRITNIENQNL